VGTAASHPWPRRPDIGRGAGPGNRNRPRHRGAAAGPEQGAGHSFLWPSPAATLGPRSASRPPSPMGARPSTTQPWTPPPPIAPLPSPRPPAPAPSIRRPTPHAHAPNRGRRRAAAACRSLVLPENTQGVEPGNPNPGIGVPSPPGQYAPSGNFFKISVRGNRPPLYETHGEKF